MNAYHIFADIIAGREPASKVYEDDDLVAFLDIRPFTRGHLLVVPRVPARTLAQLDPATGGRMFQVAQRLAAAVRVSDARCEGVNFFLADGIVAGQEVYHVHMHVIPRTRHDGFGIVGHPRQPARTELDDIARSIRGALDGLG